MERFISLKDALPIRKIIAAGVLGLTVGACGKQPEITEGFVYKKEHVDGLLILQPAGNGLSVPYQSWNIDTEAVGERPEHKKVGFDRKYLLENLGMKSFPKMHTKAWNVYVAQCPTMEPPPRERIEKEYKTVSISVSQDVFKSAEIDKQFKEP